MKLIELFFSKRALLSYLCFSIIIASLFYLTAPTAATFNANDVMDNGVFDNSGTMTASQIDNWLNSNFGSASCISTDHGFSAPQPIGYSPTGPTSSGGFSYGGDVSAGTVIYDAATAYGLNPQVILTMLEAQEGLLDGTGVYGCTATAYTQAMGYGCPDGGSIYQYSGFELYSINGTPVTSTGSSGTCVNNEGAAGFSRQVIVAAWQLKYDEERAQGNVNWNVQLSNFPNAGDVWDNSDDPPSCYPFLMVQGTFERSASTNPCPTSSSPPGNQPIYYDGTATIDNTTVQLANGATASLYDYTPHLSGNQTFDSLFTQYFGGIYAQPYYAAYVSESSYPSLTQNQQVTVSISYQNLGSQPWYDNNSLSSAPSGTNPVHLATSNPLNSISPFSSGWPSANRPAVNFSAVYLSDGQTLTSNQNIVEPGEVAQFSFTLTDPSLLNSGTYQQYFQPIVEGTADGLFPNTNTFLNVNVLPTNSLSLYSQSSDPTIAPNESSAVNIFYQNTGNVPFYDNTSLSTAPSGTDPLHLATANPLNNCSPFGASWSSCSRPAVNFTAVYQSNGTTLAPNQHIAQPGEIIEFTFTISVPGLYTANNYQTYFQPILEGTSSGGLPSVNSDIALTVPSTPVLSYLIIPTSTTTIANQPTQLTIQIINLGNLSTPSGAELYSYNGGGLQNSNWQSSSVIESLASPLGINQSQEISFTILSPETSGNYVMNLSIVSPGSTTPIIGSSENLNISVSPAVTGAAYYSQSGYPSLSYDGTSQVSFWYKNTGNQPWYDNNSISAATWRNPALVHLATAQPLNRCSGFDYNWTSCSRPAVNFTQVMNSDGSTLSSNQDVVLPGQIAEYSFSIQPNYWVAPATYREYFQPIVEGSAYGNMNFVGTYQDITVMPAYYQAGYVSESSYPTISANGTANVYFQFKNNGNVNWYDNSSVPTGRFPTHLATSNPINVIDPFGQTWPSYNRPDVDFSKVYNSDDSTLSSNQNVVMPGQIAEFDLTLSANVAPGTYYEYFQPILEGAPGYGWNMNGVVWLKITVL